MSDVLFVRHGETTWNREDRLQGWAPTQLTERGHEQMEQLALYLSDGYSVDRIVCSDLSRTRESANILQENAFPDIAVEPDIRWREQDLGIYQGLTLDEFEKHVKSPENANPAEPLDDGEALLDVRKRVVNGVEEFRESDETVVVVTHTGPIKQFVGHLRDLEPFEAFQVLDVDNASVTEVACSREEMRLVEMNQTGFLD